MRFALLFLVSLLFVGSTASQSDTTDLNTHESPKKEIASPEMAQYKNSEMGLHMFIARKVKYPNRCRDLGISGISMIQFTVTKDGEIEDVEPLYKHNTCPEFDQEAVRVIKRTSGDWFPAKQFGKPVNIRFRLPIRFSLN